MDYISKRNGTKEKADWSLPDNRQTHRMFIKDISQMGVEFCIKKYGTTKENIVAEARKIAPHINVRK